jgi:hypothetical protein
LAVIWRVWEVVADVGNVVLPKLGHKLLKRLLALVLPFLRRALVVAAECHMNRGKDRILQRAHVGNGAMSAVRCQ